LPNLTFDTHVDRGALNGHATGAFENFNPGKLANRQELEGEVSGSVNANFAVSDVSAPITPASITADGRATLESSTVGGLQIDNAQIDGKYANQIGDVARFEIAGPDVKADASGRLALDRSNSSDLKYHVEAINLPELAKLAIDATSYLPGRDPQLDLANVVVNGQAPPDVRILAATKQDASAA